MDKRDKKVKTAKALDFSSDEEKGEVKSRSEIMSSDDDEEANEDLSLKIVQKFMLRSCNNDRRDDGVSVLVTDLKDEKKKKEKRKIKKSSGIEVAEHAVVSSDIDTGFRDFCGELFLVDNVKDEGQLQTDKSVEISDKSVETNPVAVSDNSVLRKLLRGPRYFDPPDNSWGACYNCGEEGHTAVNCTSAKRKKPCFVCGSFEHNAKQCSKGRDCYICKQQGHRAKDCPEKNQSSKICLKCGDLGHDMYLCRNNYCPDDLKDIQCYICQKFGHLCCVSYSDPGPREVSCYRCGLSGHTGLACTVSHRDTNCPGSANSCYKCGGEGHFARECTSSTKACTGSRWDTNYPGSANSCYKCGGEGHFARECTSSTKSCTGSQRDTNGPESAYSCYKCGGEGHFARECTSSTKPNKRNRELLTPKVRSSKKNRDHMEVRSAPHNLGKTYKKKRTQYEEFASDVKTKHRGGWITEDPGDFLSSKAKSNNWRSPATPSNRGSKISSSNGNYASSSRPSKNPRKLKFSDSASNGPTQYYPHNFSASRYGNSNNDWTDRNYNWW